MISTDIVHQPTDRKSTRKAQTRQKQNYQYSIDAEIIGYVVHRGDSDENLDRQGSG